jgi:hypothetical protein
MATFTCFTRPFYKIEKDRHGQKKRVPYPRARRTVQAEFNTEAEAQEFCRKWNETHEPGERSVKCEYTQYF